MKHLSCGCDDPTITPDDPRLGEYRNARNAFALLFGCEDFNLQYDVASNKYDLAIAEKIKRFLKIEAPQGTSSDPYALVMRVANAISATGMKANTSVGVSHQRGRKKDLERYEAAQWLGRVYRALRIFCGDHRFCIVKGESDDLVLCLHPKAKEDSNLPSFIRNLSTGGARGAWETLVQLAESGGDPERKPYQPPTIQPMNA